jgi:hypothetical protein
MNRVTGFFCSDSVVAPLRYAVSAACCRCVAFRSATRRETVLATVKIRVWDTVRALGIPGSSGLVLWRHAFHNATLNARVPYARQALSIDENRQIFAPEIWDESEESPDAKARGRIKQIWFPGVHSDIGGGYPETGLSDLALEWMIKEAMAVEHPLVVDMTKLKLKPSHEGIQHDERTGWGRTWTEGTREGVRDGKGPDILVCTENSDSDVMVMQSTEESM